MKFTRTATIQATPEKIWDSLTIFTEAQKWSNCLLENEKISNGEICKGFKSKSLIQEGKNKIWYEEEILDYTPHLKLKLKLAGKNLGKNPMYSAYYLEKTNQGTELKQTIEWQPGGIVLKLLHKMITKMSIKNIEKELHDLKEYVEK